MIRSAEADGWDAVRKAAFRRDGGCVAVNPAIFDHDVAPDLCADQWGGFIHWSDYGRLEFDHVKEQSVLGKKPPDDEAHGVMACPWHHRLSQRWRTDSAVHREKLRDWLRKHYPEVWGA